VGTREESTDAVVIDDMKREEREKMAKLKDLRGPGKNVRGPRKRMLVPRKNKSNLIYGKKNVQSSKRKETKIHVYLK